MFWLHEDKDKATDKAKALIRGVVAKAMFLEPLEKKEISLLNIKSYSTQQHKAKIYR